MALNDEKRCPLECQLWGAIAELLQTGPNPNPYSFQIAEDAISG